MSGIYSTLEVRPDGGALRLVLTAAGAEQLERRLPSGAAGVDGLVIRDLSREENHMISAGIVLDELLREHLGPAGEGHVPGRPDLVGEGGWTHIVLDFEFLTLGDQAARAAGRGRRGRRLDGIWWEPTRRVGELVEALRRDGYVDLVPARVDDPRAPRDLRVELAETFGLAAPR